MKLGSALDIIKGNIDQLDYVQVPLYGWRWFTETKAAYLWENISAYEDWRIIDVKKDYLLLQ